MVSWFHLTRRIYSGHGKRYSARVPCSRNQRKCNPTAQKQDNTSTKSSPKVRETRPATHLPPTQHVGRRVIDKSQQQNCAVNQCPFHAVQNCGWSLAEKVRARPQITVGRPTAPTFVTLKRGQAESVKSVAAVTTDAASCKP